jgi:uncharacterized pyridoxal phosphate-containing UPF0001 family protein
VQVNTSEEPQKSGVLHSDPALPALARHIREKCQRLRFAGLMTIGESGEARRDFEQLIAARRAVADLELPEGELALSMGVSSDFEIALELGATIVRVGTAIFEARVYRK